MSFKTILVHVDDTRRSAPRLEVARRMAVTFQAQLVGVYLGSEPDLTASLAASLPAEVLERLQHRGEAQREAELAFRDAAAADGLTRFDWLAPGASPIDTAVAHGRCCDLFILGQWDPDGGIRDDLATAVLLSTGRPALIVPTIGAQSTLGERVLVAWDGGREASRAIADALPLLERAKQVAVVSVNANGATRFTDSAGAARLANWLREHGVDVEPRRYGGSTIPTGEWLLSHAADLGSDLIVMGGYGHTHARELVLGGVTRTMLQSMTVPVLMSH